MKGPLSDIQPFYQLEEIEIPQKVRRGEPFFGIDVQNRFRDTLKAMEYQIKCPPILAENYNELYRLLDY